MQKALRFITLLSAALLMGLTLTHVLQAQGSRELGGAAWLAVQHTFYGGFALVGGSCETLGLVAAATLGILSLRSRRHGSAAAFLVVAAAFAGTLLAFVFGNAPVNAMVAGSTAATLPPEWPAYRESWEAAHAISAALSAAAFLVVAGWLVRHAHEPDREEARSGRGAAAIPE